MTQTHCRVSRCRTTRRSGSRREGEKEGSVGRRVASTELGWSEFGRGRRRVRDDGSEGVGEIETKELMSSNQNGGGHGERGSHDTHPAGDQDRGFERINSLEHGEVSIEVIVFDGTVGGNGNPAKRRRREGRGREKGASELNLLCPKLEA